MSEPVEAPVKNLAHEHALQKVRDLMAELEKVDTSKGLEYYEAHGFLFLAHVCRLKAEGRQILEEA